MARDLLQQAEEARLSSPIGRDESHSSLGFTVCTACCHGQEQSSDVKWLNKPAVPTGDGPQKTKTSFARVVVN